MTHQETQAHTTQFCINCTHFRHVGLMKDQQYLCGYGASHNVVTGAPAIEESTGCFQMRATDGRCGPSAALFDSLFDAPLVAASTNPAKAGFPLNAKLLDGSVVNVTVAADKEHNAFLFGRFKRLGNPHGRGLCSGDLLNDHGEVITHRIFRIGGGCVQRFLSNVGHPSITFIDAPDAACGDDVFAVFDGVVKQVLDSAAYVGHGEALTHGYLPVQVGFSEGATVAAATLKSMLTEFISKGKTGPVQPAFI